jgi:catechol 2,3-dioxygenase-like lactoylglutathione lyase family enzyme
MPIKLENVAIAVRDLEATIAFFTDLGLTMIGRDTVSGECPLCQDQVRHQGQQLLVELEG